MLKELYAVFLLLIFDIIWIYLFMSGKYTELIKKVQLRPMSLDILAAFFAYVLMILGLLVFVLPNIDEKDKLMSSLKYGFVFGVIVYGVFNMTNKSVLTDWSWCLSIIDVIWGGFVYASVAYIVS